MASVNDVLEDNSIPGTKKLEFIKILLDTKLAKQKESINIEKIFDITTENLELKWDVLKKSFVAAKNFEENIDFLKIYFEKTLHNLENRKLVPRFLICIFEEIKEDNKIQDLLEKLGIENVNEVLLNEVFSRDIGYEKSRTIFKNYLSHLSIDDQTALFNSLFKFSKKHRNIHFLCLTLASINGTALTHETSVLRTKDFWIYLTNCLELSKEFSEAQIIIFVLLKCKNVVKNAKLSLQFLSTDDDETAWNAFLALVQVFTYGRRELLRPSLELIKYVAPLHFFWQRCVFRLLVNRAPENLKCAIIDSILKLEIKNENLRGIFEFIFSAMNEYGCKNEECPVFKEINNFCEKVNVEQFSIILDEIFKLPRNVDLFDRLLKNVLVESKKKLIDFGYFYRFETLLSTKECSDWNPNEGAEAVLKFFGDPENFDTLCQIRRSSVNSNRFSLDNSESLKDVAIGKILELSSRNSDDLKEIELYFTFIQNNEIYIDLIKNYQLSIHVRLVIYTRLFNMNGYYCAECELDKDATINDFYEYLMKHLNEKTYVTYRELMISFLDLMDRYMSFPRPDKACLEILNIVRNPEIYTQHQVYCATDILRWVYFRFYDLWGTEEEFYKEVAQKWKHLILETEDQNICKEGLYYVLEKGRLNAEEYKDIVKTLLEKHLCDEMAETIYSRYLKSDLIDLAWKRLKDIKENSSEKYKKFSELFCNAVSSREYVNSTQFSLANEHLKFCFSNSKNLQFVIYQIDFNLLDYGEYQECKGRIAEFVIEIYLNKLSAVKTKVYCLHVLLEIVSRYSSDKGRPPFYFANFKDYIKLIMNRLKQKYAENLENDINKLRIIQALMLLVPYVMLDFNRFRNIMKNNKVNIFKKLRNNLKRLAVGILVMESNSRNKAAKQTCQYMYILLCVQDVTFEEIKTIIEKVKECPDLKDSFMPVLYHVMPYCKFSKNEIEEILSSTFFLSLGFGDNLRIYAQILIQRVYKLYNNKSFKDIIEKYEPRCRQNDLDIDSNRENIAHILDTDYLFLKVLDPKRDHSRETILHILPKLNQVDCSEWKDVMNHGLLWNSNIDDFTIKKDENETLKKAVDTFLEAIDPVNTEYDNYGTEEILRMFEAPTQNPLLEKVH